MIRQVREKCGCKYEQVISNCSWLIQQEIHRSYLEVCDRHKNERNTKDEKLREKIKKVFGR